MNALQHLKNTSQCLPHTPKINGHLDPTIASTVLQLIFVYGAAQSLSTSLHTHTIAMGRVYQLEVSNKPTHSIESASIPDLSPKMTDFSLLTASWHQAGAPKRRVDDDNSSVSLADKWYATKAPPPLHARSTLAC
ncbi:hypothetical protein Hypma_001247 [Hypsizygus marmoreus]|uniref:Uncharacterized protein n=1 Tax=Hypsizygus marmoreus TaxID=39966 RepID=A0A369J7Y9_HYPMA|nr:hypothetical protein Hypma_001247 [Hypsizygus marmoreus]